MGDHLALLVDHLLTESTLDAAIGGGKGARLSSNSAPSDDSGIESIGNRNIVEPKCTGKIVECRICQEEDDDSSMEAPCSCCGSLKYAHRTCIQRWCNEKGDTICEICLQPFKPGYTAPPKLFHYGSMPMNFRGSWEIYSEDIHDSQIITMVASDRSTMDSDYEYSAASMRSTIYCRSVAVIVSLIEHVFTSFLFMILLTIRHALPLMIAETEEYSFTLFSLLVLRAAGILVPVFIMVRALTTLHQRRRQQRVWHRSTSYEGESSGSGYSHVLSSQPQVG